MYKLQYKLIYLNFLTCVNLYMIEKTNFSIGEVKIYVPFYDMLEAYSTIQTKPPACHLNRWRLGDFMKEKVVQIKFKIHIKYFKDDKHIFLKLY